ncbi:MAG TPA: flagellar biosynthesis anti-sigma factor FlgM [Clostridiales bacterium]|nr:flagellar biosynthesis anti-sigma factor FlgM [Clostridiales bacterium]
MKINPLHQSEAISKYSNIVNNTRPQNAGNPGISDSLDLSQEAQRFSSLIKEAKEAMNRIGRDEEIKVAEIINQIKNNSYHVSAEDVADKILGGIPDSI